MSVSKTDKKTQQQTHETKKPNNNKNHAKQKPVNSVATIDSCHSLNPPPPPPRFYNLVKLQAYEPWVITNTHFKFQALKHYIS